MSVKEALNSKVGKQLDPFEHARKRPMNYIGPVTTKIQKKAVVITEGTGEGEETGDVFVEKDIDFNQGLERIFIEILSNSKDNYWESQKHKVAMTFIKITVTEDGVISIENDGLPIPVLKHPYQITDHNGKKIVQEAYPAEKFFGNMNFGTNFDKDREKKKSSGLNGMGGKLTNIFSTDFQVFIKDHYNGKTFIQNYSQAGKKKDTPKVKAYAGKASSTKITFTPDYEYFGFEKIEDFESLIKRHAYDTAFVFPGLRVVYNGKNIKFSNFPKIVDFYSSTKTRMHFVYPNGDECVVVPTTEGPPTDRPLCVSFVNGIRCDLGGTHVDEWASLILNKFKNLYNTKAAKEISKKEILYPFFEFYVRSETEEEIGFEHGNVKDRCIIPEIFMTEKDKAKKQAFSQEVTSKVQKMFKWDIVNFIRSKMVGKPVSVKKTNLLYGKNHQHANKFGPNYKGTIERIGAVTEGESASKLFENIKAKTPGGPDYYGGIWIRGKFSNVEKKSNGKAIDGGADLSDVKSLAKDKTYTDLMAFYGLRYGVDYNLPVNRKTLNYDKAWAMTDADDDGIHIRGLLIAFFAQFPGLLDSGFFGSFNTYNVILIPKNKKLATEYFCSHFEFQKWLNEKERDLDKYTPKYFKGLGSYSNKDALLHVTEEGRKINTYIKDPKAVHSLKLAFSAKSGPRKEWMKEAIGVDMSSRVICPPVGNLDISSFVNNDLVYYHIMTLSRALPSRIDGMKQSQRQIVDTGLAEMITKQRGVVEFEGLIKSHTNYEHGSISDVIGNMAVGYPGSNNFPLFLPIGGYASRVKDRHAAARYLSTQATPEIKFIYRDEDIPLLKRRINSGKKCEYEYLLPVAPLHLINGCKGVASGWITDIPCYNPDDIINALLECLDGEFDEHLEDFLPWYREFIGKVYYEEGKLITEGIVTKVGNKYLIKEIPIGTTLPELSIKYIQPMMGETEKATKKATKTTKKTKLVETKEKVTAKIALIEDATNNVLFPRLFITPKRDQVLKKSDFSFLKNKTSTFFNVVGEDGIPITFKSARALLKDFYETRIKFYGPRRKYWMNHYALEISYIDAKIAFIKAVNSGEIDMHQKEVEIIGYLEGEGYIKKEEKYDYLLNMPIRTLTIEKIKQLSEQKKELIEKMMFYKKSTPESLYRQDLLDFKEAWKSFLDKTVVDRDEIRVD